MNFRKLFFAFGALGMLLSSCSKVSEIEYLDESAGLPCEITATFDATRTSIDDNWNTTWDNNDVMTVYVTRKPYSSNNIYGCSQFTYKGNGEFSGTVDSNIADPYNWFAVYPSIELSSSTTSKVSAEIEHPASQTMTGSTKSHIAGSNDPIFGYALGIQDNPKIRMHHIASVIDFNITNGSDKAIKVTKIEFTAPGKIAGKFTADVDLKGGQVEAPAWTADNSAVNTVTLNVTNGVEIAKESTGQFYAAIHPISAEGDYTIKVTATSEGKTYVTQKTVKTNLTFEAGKYQALNYTFTPGQPEPDQKCYVKVTSAPQDWSGTYLIVDESAKKAFDENSGSYASSVTINDGKVLWDETVAKYQVVISPSSVSGMYDVKTVKGQYMYSYNDGGTTLNSSNKDNRNYTYYNRLSIDGGNVTIYSTRGSDGSLNYFGYVSKTSDNPNSKNFGYKKDATTRKVQLYKLTEGSPEPPTPVTEKTYELVSTLTEGTYIICGYETASDRVGTWGCLFPPVDKSLSSIKTGNYCNHIQLATTAGVTSFTTTNAELIASEVELVKSGNNWSIKLKSSGQYMYYNSSAKKIDFTTSASSAAHTITSGSNKCFAVIFGSGSRQEFYHSGTDKGFGYRPENSTSNIQFYKLSGETPVEKKEQTLSFSKDPYEVTAAVGTVVDANTFSGAMTTVTYTSSKETVATVAADGKLTIKGEGTATITATAAENDTYKSATKSYTLNVTLPAPSTEKTYTKATSFVSGKKYIIVYEGKALQNNNGTPAAYSVTASGNTLTLSSNVASTLEWTASAVSSYTVSGHYSLSNNGKYAARTDDGKNGFEFQTSAVQKAVWDLDNEGNDLYHINSTGQYTFYLTYSSSNWTVSSQSASNKTVIYVENGDTPTPVTEKTYTKVNSISEGTYIICGSEDAGTYVCLFPPVTAKNSSFTTSNKCEHTLFSSSNSITEIKTSDASITGSEVEITKSGSNWLVKYKATGNYMYHSNNAIAFTSNATSAVQTISLSSGKGSMKTGTYEFYHSTTDQGFGYKSNKGANNLMFFKLSEGGDTPTPGPVTPDGTIFNLENTSVSNFLTDAASQYTDANISSTSIVTNYCKSYYTNSTREDIPAPVTLSWSNTASGTKTVTIYNNEAKTDKETSVTTTSTSADIYNLIPGKTYYYTVSTSSNPNIASGYFKTEGRRRMMLVGEKSNFGQNYANNCRDFGGLKTTSGKTVKYGKIFRGSNMDYTTSAQRSYLKEYMKIGLDVDLRGYNGNPLDVNQSIKGYTDQSSLQVADDIKETLSDIFNAVNSGTGVYIHCLVGADRTGYVSILINAILGVSKKDCSIDYELTSFSTIGTRRRTGKDNSTGPAAFTFIDKQSGSTFQEKAVNYVVNTLGITQSVVTAFQNNMLE